MYYLAAGFLVLIGFAHSYLGERYILMRLFRRNNLPELFGGSEFTRSTLRFAWHITSIAWFGFAVILLHLQGSNPEEAVIGNIIAVTFLLHAGVALIASKGRHLSWVVFLIVGLATVYGSNL